MSEEWFLPQLFKCHGCIEMCSSPVALCINGHHICSACVKTQAECPMCRVPGTPSIRNVAGDGLVDQVLAPPAVTIAMDGLIAQVLAPPNSSMAMDGLIAQVLAPPNGNMAMDGLIAQVLAPPNGNIADTLVVQVVAPDDTLQRQGVKRKRPEDVDDIYKCEVCDNCLFSGTRSALYHHVKTAEPGNVEFLEQNSIAVYMTSRNANFCTLLKWNEENEDFWDEENEYFWVFSSYDVISGNFYFYARYIGPDEKAGNFKLKWRISTKDEETAVICFVRELLFEKEHFLKSDKTIVLSETCFDVTPRVGREIRYGIESIMRT